MKEMNLSDVLEEYAIASPLKNDIRILRQMIEKHPEFAEELQDFAAACSVEAHVPDSEFTAEERSRFEEIGMQNLRVLLGESAPLSSLTDAAKAKGMNRSRFAMALGLSVSLVQYLEKRRLIYLSIPEKIVAKIGEVLETGAEAVAEYLQQPPVSAANANFKASERPEEQRPKTFAEAVNEDQTLSADQKRELSKP